MTTLIRAGLVLLGPGGWCCLSGQGLTIEVSATEVERYAKVELTLTTDTRYRNPFDPDEVDLSVEFTSPTGKKLTLPVFYYQHFERRDKGERAEWLYPVGQPVWKARFAPSQVGTYSCRATRRDRNGVSASNAVSLECVPSQRRGFLRVSRSDPRFLEFSDGTPFFAIGQNVAFITNTYRAGEMFERIAQAGGNWVRVWTCCKDWAMGLEGRKSAWAHSWGWSPPIVVAPGQDGYLFDRRCLRLTGEDGASLSANPFQTVALRPDTRYLVSGSVRTEPDTALSVQVNGQTVGEPLTGTREVGEGRSVPSWTRFQREFSSGPDDWWLRGPTFRKSGEGAAWLMDLHVREAPDGPELPLHADPNEPISGYYQLLDSFMLDKIVEAAEENGIYLQLCVVTRDLYMDSLADPKSPEYEKATKLAQRFMRYVVARWGYSTNVAVWEYFNEMNPHLPSDRFYQALGEYLEQIDVFHHLRATSVWGPPHEKDWRHPKLDVADMHGYLRPMAEGGKDAVAFVLGRCRKFREGAASKPALYSEFGLMGDNFGLSEYLEQDKELVHLHNALWTSALSGLSGTTMHWWWDEYGKMGVYRHYRPLADFLADIPWTTGGLREASVVVSDDRVRVVGLQGKDCAYLWLSDRQATWWNLAVQKQRPAGVRGAAVSIQGLNPGTYTVQWWDTWEGKMLKQEKASPAGQALSLEVPVFFRDIACKVASG